MTPPNQISVSELSRLIGTPRAPVIIDGCIHGTFSLTTEPLKRLAKIVRGADTNRHDLAPEAAGLHAAVLGVSQMHQNDLDQLDAGPALFDAFYRWARDASHEGRSRPVSVKAG